MATNTLYLDTDKRSEQQVGRATFGLRALLRRLLRTFMLSAKQIGPRERERLLAAESDFDVALALLRQQVADNLVASPLAAAKLRGIERQRAMLEEAGPMISSSEAARILGISRQAVEKRIQSDTLLGLKTGGRLLIPLFMIEMNAKALKRILQSMQINDPWMRLNFFVAKDASLRNRSPMDAIKSGDIEGVERAARGYGEHGGR